MWGIVNKAKHLGANIANQLLEVNDEVRLDVGSVICQLWKQDIVEFGNAIAGRAFRRSCFCQVGVAWQKLQIMACLVFMCTIGTSKLISFELLISVQDTWK